MSRTTLATRPRHIALVATALVLMGGSAYAGSQLGPNSVGARQVKNNSLTSADIKNGAVTGRDLKAGAVTGRSVRDGSLRKGDLAAGTLPTSETQVIFRRVTVEEGAFVLFEDPDIGLATFTCSTGGNMGWSAIIPEAAVPGIAGVRGIDDADTDPVGAATVSAPNGTSGGSAGVGGSNWLLATGEIFLVDPNRTVDIVLKPTIGSPCTLRATITVTDSVPGTFPLARTAGRGQAAEAECTETGSATCLVD